MRHARTVRQAVGTGIGASPRFGAGNYGARADAELRGTTDVTSAMSRMPSRTAGARLLPTKAIRREGGEMNRDPCRNRWFGFCGRGRGVRNRAGSRAPGRADPRARRTGVGLVPASVFSIGGAFLIEPSIQDRALLEDAAATRRRTASSQRRCCCVGDTVDEIVAYADSHNVDLIVVGRGVTGRSAQRAAWKRLARSPRRSRSDR